MTAPLKRLLADLLSWLFFLMMAVGFGGFMLSMVWSQWFGGIDFGCPANPLCGVGAIGYVFQNWGLLVLLALGGLGAVGLSCVAPHSSYRKKP